MTLLLYSRRKGWPLQSVRVELDHRRVHCRDMEDCEEAEDRLIELIERRIFLTGPLSEDQRARLHYIAHRCPVHRTLTAPPRIRTETTIDTTQEKDAP